MPTIRDQLIAKCEEAKESYPDDHPQRLAIEKQIDDLKRAGIDLSGKKYGKVLIGKRGKKGLASDQVSHRHD